jgi:hypothetical protein
VDQEARCRIAQRHRQRGWRDAVRLVGPEYLALDRHDDRLDLLHEVRMLLEIRV